MNLPLTELRKHRKKQRAQLPIKQQQRDSKRAVRQLQRTRQFRSARHIALYLPVRGEISPVSLRNFARPNQTFYLPVLSLCKSQGLVFVRWDKNTRFRTNRFGIPEPLVRHNRLKSPRSLDLVVTPLLAFDQAGNRLGMGGGFYDRSFAFKRHNKHHPRPQLAGFAYQFQQAEKLPAQPWDVPLDLMATELRVTEFTARQY